MIWDVILFGSVLVAAIVGGVRHRRQLHDEEELEAKIETLKQIAKKRRDGEIG